MCDNPLCQKHLRNQKYYEVITSEGKLCVCDDVCEQMAKFKKLNHKRGYLDCLKFFQATLSGGGNHGTLTTDKRKTISPMNPDIDISKLRHPSKGKQPNAEEANTSTF